jgi:glutathione S-transferase
MEPESRLSSSNLASSIPMGDQSNFPQVGRFDSEPFRLFRPPTEAVSQPLQNATHAPHAFIRPPQPDEPANSFLSASQSTQQHQSDQGHSGNGVASHLQPQGRSPNRAGLHQSQEFSNGVGHAAHMRGALHATAAGQMAPPPSLSQNELAMGNHAHQAQNNGLATMQSPSQHFQPDFIDLDTEPADPASFAGSGELQGFRMVTDPPNLEYWRDRLFNVDEMITLSEEEYADPFAPLRSPRPKYAMANLQMLYRYQTYFPHVDNVYSHRSTQRYKRKPFVSHYWDCRLKGRPPGTPKSDDPEKKKRKRTARERDLCHVKIKVVEYFPVSETSNSTNPVEPLPTNLLPGMYTFSLNGDTPIQSVQPFSMLPPNTGLPPNHPGLNGGRYFTIQRVNGNGANGKNDGVSGGHQHTLEESDRVKKSSVQRYALKEKKDKRTRAVCQSCFVMFNCPIKLDEDLRMFPATSQVYIDFIDFIRTSCILRLQRGSRIAAVLIILRLF